MFLLLFGATREGESSSTAPPPESPFPRFQSTLVSAQRAEAVGSSFRDSPNLDRAFAGSAASLLTHGRFAPPPAFDPFVTLFLVHRPLIGWIDDTGDGQVRQAVIKKPRLLGMSLENRLVPRLQQMRRAGITASWELHHEVGVGTGLLSCLARLFFRLAVGATSDVSLSFVLLHVRVDFLQTCLLIGWVTKKSGTILTPRCGLRLFFERFVVTGHARTAIVCGRTCCSREMRGWHETTGFNGVAVRGYPFGVFGRCGTTRSSAGVEAGRVAINSRQSSAQL